MAFPITTKQPEPDRFAKEIPETEKRRAGLDKTARSWIILDEINTDHIGKSYHLEPDCQIGRFSRAFTLQVFRTWLIERRKRRITFTPRSD